MRQIYPLTLSLNKAKTAAKKDHENKKGSSPVATPHPLEEIVNIPNSFATYL